MGSSNKSAIENISCGMFVITSNDGKKHNGMICNTAFQITNSPNRIAVAMNKQSYSHDIIKNTGKMNLNLLSVDAPFKVFEHFGFRSGKDTDKFAECSFETSQNGLVILPKYINSYISLEVESYVDVGTHGLFICAVTQQEVVSDKESMTYSYYHENVKPKPESKGVKGWVCKICGYVYEGSELPADFVCPLCLHGAEDFEPIE